MIDISPAGVTHNTINDMVIQDFYNSDKKYCIAGVRVGGGAARHGQRAAGARGGGRHGRGGGGGGVRGRGHHPPGGRPRHQALPLPAPHPRPGRGGQQCRGAAQDGLLLGQPADLGPEELPGHHRAVLQYIAAHVSPRHSHNPRVQETDFSNFVIDIDIAIYNTV